MIVQRLRTTKLHVPLPVPATAARGAGFSALGIVLVHIETAEHCGVSYIVDLNGRRTTVLAGMIESLAPLVVGEPVHDVERLYQAMRRDVVQLGRSGIAMMGISAIDMALWDAFGRWVGQPLYRLFGGYRNEVAIYASGKFWLSQPIDTVVADAVAAVQQGFGALKLRVGSDKWRDDVARIRAVRDAVGPDIAIMVDANQGLTDVAEAVRLARALEPLGIAWFEEPFAPEDLYGTAKVTAAVDVPVALGECLYGLDDFRAAIEKRAASVLMPDMQRCGGFTGMLKIARLAEAHGVAVSPHIFYTHSAHVVAASPACTYVEHTARPDQVFGLQLPPLSNGTYPMPDRPGHGFDFDADFIQRYRIE